MMNTLKFSPIILLFCLMGRLHGQEDSLYQTLKGVQHFDKVFLLSLRDQGLRKIPSDLVKCRNLKYLDLGLNKIRSIDAINGIDSLKVLSLWGNPIKSIDFVCELKALEDLILMECPVKDLPCCIKNLQKLHTLNLIDTSITTMPPVIKELVHLKVLAIAKVEGTPNFSSEQIDELRLAMPWCSIY